MAVFCFKDASVVINTVDLSDHVKSVTMNVPADILDNTAMGATFKSRIAGLKDWSIDVDFHQDFAAAKVDATLFPLIGAAAFTVTVKPTSAAVSATNPSYSGSMVLESYPPLAGSVGDLASASITLQGAGVCTRAVA